jgi:hypothetical protein
MAAYLDAWEKPSGFCNGGFGVGRPRHGSLPHIAMMMIKIKNRIRTTIQGVSFSLALMLRRAILSSFFSMEGELERSWPARFGNLRPGMA